MSIIRISRRRFGAMVAAGALGTMCALGATNAWAEGHHGQPGGHHTTPAKPWDTGNDQAGHRGGGDSGGDGDGDGERHGTPPAAGIPAWAWGNALHGQLTLPGASGMAAQTVILQQGTVTGVSGTTITVLSADGYVGTWTVTSGTAVSGHHHHRYGSRSTTDATATATSTSVSTATATTTAATTTACFTIGDQVQMIGTGQAGNFVAGSIAVVGHTDPAPTSSSTTTTAPTSTSTTAPATSATHA